jgi:hydrogenase maturation protease
MRVRVIGCGNRDRRDDAAGILAVERVAPSLAGLPGVEVSVTASALDAVDLLEGIDAAVLVDAVRSPDGARTPGTIVLDVRGLPGSVRSSLSSHGLGLAEAASIAAALGRAPRVVFVGVEVADASDGAEPSPVVTAAIPRMAAAIEAEVLALLGSVGPKAPLAGGRPA